MFSDTIIVSLYRLSSPCLSLRLVLCGERFEPSILFFFIAFVGFLFAYSGRRIGLHHYETTAFIIVQAKDEIKTEKVGGASLGKFLMRKKEINS